MTWRAVLNFSQIGQEVWKVLIKMHLCPWVRYDCHWANFCWTHANLAHFYKELLFQNLWKFNRGLVADTGSQIDRFDLCKKSFFLYIYKEGPTSKFTLSCRRNRFSWMVDIGSVVWLNIMVVLCFLCFEFWCVWIIYCQIELWKKSQETVKQNRCRS